MTDATPTDERATESGSDLSEHETQQGTVATTFAFLAMCVFMFGWAYYLLILRA